MLPRNWLRRLRNLLSRRGGKKKKPHNPALRVEHLEDRLAPAALWTDQPDYSPNSTATIFGSGYLQDETVELRVVHVDSTYSNQYAPWRVTDGDTTPAYVDSFGV